MNGGGKLLKGVAKDLDKAEVEFKRSRFITDRAGEKKERECRAFFAATRRRRWIPSPLQPIQESLRR